MQVPQTATPFGAPTAADRFLLDAMTRAMKASRSLRAHGAARFRLEQLLSSSNDKLAMFDRKRNGRKEGDDNIVVKVVLFSLSHSHIHTYITHTYTHSLSGLYLTHIHSLLVVVDLL